MKPSFPIFNNVPPEAVALVEAAKGQPRLEFISRGGETPEQTRDTFKDYARSVVAANEKNGFAMPLTTFLSLWAKA
jgi:hypothetical protein